MTKRLLRIGLWIAAAVAAVAVVCGLVLKLLFDPNDYRDDIERAFLERTGRELELEGRLGLSLLPRLAVRTGPFSVANAAGFGDRPLLSVGDARLNLRLWPLLSRRLEFGRIELDAPRANLQIDGRGRDNWHSLFERRGKAVPPTELAPQRPASTSFEVAGLHVTSGQVSYEDRRSATRYDISGLELDTGTLSASRPVRVDLAFDFTTEPGQHPRSAKVEVEIQHAATSWTLQDLKAELGWPVGAADKRIPVVLTADTASYDTTSHRLELPAYTLEAADAKLNGSLAGTVAQPVTALAGPLTLERVNLRRVLPALDVPVPATRDEKALTSLNAHARVEYGPKSLALNALEGRLDDTQFKGSIQRGAADPAAVGFALALDQIDIDRYLPPPAAAPDAAPRKSDAGSPGAVRTLKAEGTVAAKRVRIAGFDLRNARASLRARDGVVAADPLQAKVFDGDSVTRLTLDLRGATPALEVDQRLSAIDMAALLRQTLQSERLTGRASLNAHLTAAGATAARLRESLRGTFETRIVNGTFTGVDLWNEIERGVAVAQGRAPPARPATPRTPYDEFTAHGRLDGRVIGIERFDGANEFLKARGSGQVDYRAATCDLNLVATLTHTPEGEIAGQPVAQLAGIDIGMTVRGPLADPKVRPDVGRLLEATARQRLHEEGEKVEKKLKDKVQDVLKGVLGQ